MGRARCEWSLSPQRGEGRVRGGYARNGIGILARIGVFGIPTPHPAFGHFLPVEGRRNAESVSPLFHTRVRVEHVPMVADRRCVEIDMRLCSRRGEVVPLRVRRRQ